MRGTCLDALEERLNGHSPKIRRISSKDTKRILVGLPTTKTRTRFLFPEFSYFLDLSSEMVFLKLPKSLGGKGNLVMSTVAVAAGSLSQTDKVAVRDEHKATTVHIAPLLASANSLKAATQDSAKTTDVPKISPVQASASPVEPGRFRRPCEPKVSMAEVKGQWIESKRRFGTSLAHRHTPLSFQGPVTVELPDGTTQTTKSVMTGDLDFPWELDESVVLEDKDFIKPKNSVANFRFLTMNGMKVLLVSDRRAVKDSVEVFLPCGLSHAPGEQPGIAHLAEHCIINCHDE